MTVRAYVRVSTDSQAATGHGLDAQRKTISAEANRRGWEDVVWYIDGGFSGKDLDRPAMADLLSVIRRGDVLVIAKLDRLSRSLSDFADLMERAQRQKWNVVALDLGIDLSTPNGEFMASVLAAMARWERRIIGQRTKEGMAAARAKGVLPGRRSTLPPEVQARLLALRDQGLTLTVIANRLNAEGVPTATGTRWTTSAVYSSTAPRLWSWKRGRRAVLSDERGEEPTDAVAWLSDDALKAMSRTCEDCAAAPYEPCHLDCSSGWN